MQNDPVENAEVKAAGQFGAGRGVGIRVRSVSKSYAGREVLKTLDVEVAAGEFVAIVGRSGCGKSTLLRLIAGLEQASGGGIGFGAHGEKPEIRIMFQDSRLLPWKRVLDNVGLGLPRASLASAKALAQVGLEERAGEWPAVLSGGQRQRVALARALVHDPELLLLDEPLGALDALTRIEMQQLIESLWKERGFTAVLVTHDVQEAIALADRVLLIEDGEITLDERISLPRPRARGNLAFAQLEERILARVLKHPAAQPDSALGDVSLQRTVSQVGWAI
jgi:sulfonate transport system ATP-binding protein